MNKVLAELEKQLHTEEDIKIRIDIMNRLGWELRRLDREKSKKLYEEANTLSQQLEYEIGFAESYLGIAIHEAYADKNDAALKKFRKVQQIFESCCLIDGQIKVLNSIGYTYGKLGKKDKALEAYMKGLALSKEAGNSHMAVFFLNNIGEIYKDVINIYDEALKYYFEAVEHCEKTGSTIYGIILSSIGECYHKLGDNYESLRYAQEGLQKSLESEDKTSIGYSHHTLGKIYIHLNDVANAMKHLEQSLDFRRATNNKYGNAEILSELGCLYITINEYDKAILLLDEAINLAEEINAAFLLSNMHKLIAEAYEKKELYEASVRHYKKHIALNNQVISHELETKISALSADMKLQQVKKDAEIYKLKNVELKEKTLEIERKAKELEESYSNIAVISEIGQKITSSLDPEVIMNTVYDTINTLIDATVFGLGLYDEDNEEVEYKIFIEDSKRLPLFKTSIYNEESLAAECIKTKEAIFINDLLDDGTQVLIPDDNTDAESRPARSLIYYPLIIEDRAIGAITVQSYKENAYTEQNLNTVKALASYISIALTNARKTDELKSTLHHLKDTQEYLIQSEKMAALGQLISGIAHEINTPLGAIQASINNISEYTHHTIGEKLPYLFAVIDIQLQQLFFEMLHNSMEKDVTISSKDERKLKRALRDELEGLDIEDSDSLADSLVDIGIYDNIKRYLPLFRHDESHFIMQICYELSGILRNIKNMSIAVEKASKMLYALKNYAHFDRTDTAIEANIVEGIETVLALYHNHIKHGTELIKKFDTLPKISCFPDELNQVWTNLIHNALQAMEYKGTLTIEAFEEEDYIVVCFTDSGPGIPEKIKEKIFQPFFTTKKQGEGSGLGLGIVRKIVNKHNGQIEVDSMPGRTCFTVKLSKSL